MSRDENRTKFPTIAGVLDMVREHCPGAKVVYAKEGENEAGDRARHDEWDTAAAWHTRRADD